MADRSTDMTLAFTREALERLEEPRAAIEDARTWSEYVGAVSAAPNGALTYTRERGISLDFFSGTRPPTEALFGVTGSYGTERYVLVGVDGQADLTERRQWEFQHVEDAAERAGWELSASGDATDGFLSTTRERLRDAFGR
jgi:hypothetical protein